ncbi:MAG TPA: FtsQ-type POTRA domain-containing protein [Acidimicrobiia bacterium]
MSTATAPIDPRIRARRAAVMRAQGRRRLRLLVAATAAATIVAGGWLLVNSAALDVDRIVVRGAADPVAAEVRAAAGVAGGDALLLLDAGDVERRIEAVPAVLDARVERDLPDALRITVVERTPAAWAARGDGSVAVLDRTGRVIAAATTPPALPEIRGLERVPVPGAAGAGSRDGAGVVAELPGELGSRVVAVVVGGGAVALELDDGVEVRLGRPRDLARKGRTAVAVLAASGEAPVAYVDVRVPAAPVTGSA